MSETLRERVEKLPRYEYDAGWGMIQETEGYWLKRSDVLAEVGAESGPHCGKVVTHFIAGASWLPCALPKGHEGDCRAAGECFKHGKYLGEPHKPPQCPNWPDCATAPQPSRGDAERALQIWQALSLERTEELLLDYRRQIFKEVQTSYVVACSKESFEKWLDAQAPGGGDAAKRDA